MHNNLLKIAFKLFLALVAIIVFYFFSQQHTTSKKKAPQTTSAKQISLSQIALDRQDGFHIKADCMNSQDKNILCDNVHCTIINKQQKAAYLNAQHTNLNTDTKDIFLTSTVTGTFDDINIKGSDFDYSFSKQTISSNKKATLTHPKFIISSNQTKIDLNDKSIELCENIESELYLLPSSNDGY